MRSLKIHAKFLISVLLTTVVAGCVAPLPPRPNSDFAYYPKARPGITTVEEAKDDLAVMLQDLKGKSIEVIRDKKQERYHFSSMEEFTTTWQKYKGRCRATTDQNTSGSGGFTIGSLWCEAFSVSDKGIEVKLNPPLLFSDLLNDKLVVSLGSLRTYDNYDYCYEVKFANRYSFIFGPTDLAIAQRFVDNLFVIQEHFKKQESVFEQQAARYRELAVKPVVTEEQRKLIVQANALSQQKAYADALEFYDKALAIDPVSYPAAYFNMALLSAQENRFRSAIGYMKKYLLLEPNASDARSAQDKIYEWELMVSKQG